MFITFHDKHPIGFPLMCTGAHFGLMVVLEERSTGIHHMRTTIWKSAHLLLLLVIRTHQWSNIITLFYEILYKCPSAFLCIFPVCLCVFLPHTMSSLSAGSSAIHHRKLLSSPRCSCPILCSKQQALHNKTFITGQILPHSTHLHFYCGCMYTILLVHTFSRMKSQWCLCLYLWLNNVLSVSCRLLFAAQWRSLSLSLSSPVSLCLSASLGLAVRVTVWFVGYIWPAWLQVRDRQQLVRRLPSANTSISPSPTNTRRSLPHS